MWWFLKKSRRPQATASSEPNVVSKRSRAEDGLLAQVPDLSALDANEVAVKIWLPEEVAQTMKWVADYEGLSQSAWVRASLVAYVYGSVAVLAQTVRKDRGQHRDRVLYSLGEPAGVEGRWIYKVPQLGKNTVAFKVWLSQQMRDDLEILAGHAGRGLSPFIREAVIGELYGRGSLPERPEIIGPATVEALAWERNEEVSEVEVEEDAFNGLGTAVRAWVEAKEGTKKVPPTTS